VRHVRMAAVRTCAGGSRAAPGRFVWSVITGSAGVGYGVMRDGARHNSKARKAREHGWHESGGVDCRVEMELKSKIWAGMGVCRARSGNGPDVDRGVL
jgi:hypothetical protein